MPAVSRPAARRLRKVFVALAFALCAVASLVTLAGCEATDVDVYVLTSQVTVAADGSETSVAYELDDAGNAVVAATTVRTADGAVSTSETAASYNTYGIVEPQDGSVQVEYDDAGQPLSLVYLDADGTPTASYTYTYTEVRGHLRSESGTCGQLSYSVTYDQNDGWPIEGTLSAYGTTVDLVFTYEVDENGAVVRQIIDLAGEPGADLSFARDDDGNVASVTAADGTTTSYTYELVAAPSPYAMVRALVHPVDVASLAELLAPTERL